MLFISDIVPNAFFFPPSLLFIYNQILLASPSALLIPYNMLSFHVTLPPRSHSTFYILCSAILLRNFISATSTLL
jgi:hypothetical protein